MGSQLLVLLMEGGDGGMVGVLENSLRSILSEFGMDQMASLLPFLCDLPSCFPCARLTFRCLKSLSLPLGAGGGAGGWAKVTSIRVQGSTETPGFPGTALCKPHPLAEREATVGPLWTQPDAKPSLTALDRPPGGHVPGTARQSPFMKQFLEVLLDGSVKGHRL